MIAVDTNLIKRSGQFLMELFEVYQTFSIEKQQSTAKLNNICLQLYQSKEESANKILAIHNQ